MQTLHQSFSEYHQCWFDNWHYSAIYPSGSPAQLRHTWAIAASTAWDNAVAYVNIYCRHIICPKHWPPACLRSWAEFNFAGKPAVVCEENILCEHHLWSQCTSVRRFDLYLEVKWLKIVQFDLHFEYIWVCRWSIADVPGTQRDRSQNVVSCNHRLRRR